MKLNTIVFGALIALSTSALQASEVTSNGDVVKQPEILASVSTDKVVPLTAQEAKDTRGTYQECSMNGCRTYQSYDYVPNTVYSWYSHVMIDYYRYPNGLYVFASR